MSLLTPTYNLKNFENVYEPREDTFLILDALESDLSFIQSLKPITFLEVGSGSGVLITSLASYFKNQSLFFATDINPSACLCTKQTALLNDAIVECINTDLLHNINVTFDVILFNPPYVCTDHNEIVPGINRAWAGGKDGRVIIDEFLSQLKTSLAASGICYMVLLKENKPYEIMSTMKTSGLTSSVIGERKILGEHLFVIRLVKKCNV